MKKNNLGFSVCHISLFFMAMLLFQMNTLFGQVQNDRTENWLVLGPFSVSADVGEKPSEALQQEWFEKEVLDPAALAGVKEGVTYSASGKDYVWKKAVAEKGFLDLDKLFDSTDFAYAYSWQTIDMDEAGDRLVGIGSDDAVKIWLNGRLVHEYWTPRAHQFNEDLVVFPMKKGRNTILVKVQDMEYDWGFSLNTLEKTDFPDLLVQSASRGMLDQADLLLQFGADLNRKGKTGLTPWQAARVKGRMEMTDFLASKGSETSVPWPAKETQAEQLFRQTMEGIQPGAAVLIAQNGKLLFEKGFGYADRENKIPVTPQTKFRIGSITKQFIAAAILKLHEDGKIHIQDRLSKFLPDFPRGDEVTIHHLLTHTSGIHSYTNETDFVDRVASPISADELVSEIRGFDYDFNPGESWSYNNSGYFLLGYLVGKLTGMPYGEFLKKQFFDPLGMNNTGVYEKDLDLTNEAIGYSFENGTVAKALDWDMSWAGGAGSLYSTVGDLYRWNEAVFSGKVLKEETLGAAFSPVKLNNGERANTFGPGGYGYGWIISEFRGATEISHGGGLHGFITHLARYPDQNLTAIVLTNCTPPQFLDPASAGRELVEIFAWDQLGKQASFSTSTKVNYDLYEDYTGWYEYPGGAIMTISREDDRLFAQMATQGKAEIFPKSDNEFYWKIVDAQIAFERDATGKVTFARHTQGGQTINAPRIKMEKEIEIDPALYDNYTGEYQLGPVVVTISRKNDQLLVQITGQPPLEVFPSSETEFFFKIVRARILFDTGDDGKATQLTLEQGGIKQVAIRKN